MSPQQGDDRSIEELVSELQGAGATEDDDPAARTEELFERVIEPAFGDRPVDIDGGLVKQSLDELLVVLVALRSHDTHGKGVMGDIERFFGAELSPGTVYPALHRLEEEGVLEMRELVQTKEYAVEDREAIRRSLGDAMRQHLAVGLVLRYALTELEALDGDDGDVPVDEPPFAPLEDVGLDSA